MNDEVPTIKTQYSILFIDDEPDTLARLDDIFSKHFSCHFAKTGEDGIRLFNQVKPPMVVCDVNLPDLSGLQICQTLKKNHSDLCLVLFSAYNDKQSRIEGLEANADNYIDKSLSDKEIFLRIRNMHPSIVNANKRTFQAVKNEPSESILDDLYIAFSSVYSKFLPKTHAMQIEDTALILSLSVRTLQRRITDETTSTFQELHNGFRLNEAKKRLKQGYTAIEVADRLGFSSPSHFSSCFKMKFNMTPSAYKSIKNL